MSFSQSVCFADDEPPDWCGVVVVVVVDIG